MIAAAVRYMWNAWNIRGFMIISLCMQLLLDLVSPFRKKTSNGVIIFVIWSAYFISDWAAIFAFGLISNAGCKSLNNKTEVAQNVMAFWAAFLLIHLGGHDTITAFSLEDNALWLRHLVGLIAQVFAFLHIFAKTLPDNKLMVPTILIFVSGVIKYGERTRALYLASLENLKKSIKKNPNLDVDINSDCKVENDEARFPVKIRPAYHFHKIFKGFVVDIMLDFYEWNESREFVMQKDAKEVFCLISTELNFLYEVIYTKIMAANSRWGVLIRNIAYYSTLAAFIWFFLDDKDELRRVDVAITYALFAGVYDLEITNFVMVHTFNWAYLNYYRRYLYGLPIGQRFFRELMIYVAPMSLFKDSAIKRLFDRLQLFFRIPVELMIYGAPMSLFKDTAIKRLFNRLRSEKMGLFNLLSHCLSLSQRWPRKCWKTGFIWEKLSEMRHISKEVFKPELWRLVYEDVKNKAVDATDAERMRRVYDARGDWAIAESGCHDLMHYINGFQYDNTLLIWHVATEICFNLDKDGAADEMKNYSKILSHYMMYLLVMQPKLMSAVAGIGHIRYDDHTCFEAKLLGVKLRGMKFRASTMPEFCALILEEHTEITEPDINGKHYLHSVLNDACGLVRLLRENNDRWEIMFKVWMEMLEYAAGHCKADSHARMLSEGGEFITFVWMLMAHYGIGAHFPVK